MAAILTKKLPLRVIQSKDRNRDIPHRGFLFLYFLPIFLWSMDYRAETSGGGSFIQIPILFIYLLASTIIIFRYIQKIKKSSSLYLLVFFVLLFDIFSSVVGLSSGQEVWAVFANAISVFIFLLSALTTYIVLANIDVCQFESRLKNVCLAFMSAHFFVIIFARGGLDLTTSRYEFLSGATVPATAILAMMLFLRFGLKETLMEGVNVPLILLSVTRMHLVNFLGQVFAAFVSNPSSFFSTSSVKKSMSVIFLVFLVLAVDIGAGLGLTDRWIERITAKNIIGIDPSSLARIAETRYMLTATTSSFSHFLFGNGIAAPTKLVGPEAALVASAVGVESVSFSSNGFGHNTPVDILYIGGLFWGVPLLTLTFLNGLQSFGVMRKLLKEKRHTPSLIYIGIWGSLIVIGMLICGTMSDTIGERPTSLWYGIGTGMLYWARQEIKNRRVSSISDVSDSANSLFTKGG